jgi:beta-glucosidase-like glycosyl hydrolase
MATIDDKVRRILRVAVRFGWIDHEQADLSIPRDNEQGNRVALQAAREGIVLLKNEGNLLPLDASKIKTIAVIGPTAYPAGYSRRRKRPGFAVFLNRFDGRVEQSARHERERSV